MLENQGKNIQFFQWLFADIAMKICISFVRVVTLAPKGQNLIKMEQEILLLSHP
jgi:hypothetical protein